MNTAVINLRVDSDLKTLAQKVADDLGFGLSSLINAYLKNFVKTKTVYFSAVEQPSEFLVKTLAKTREELKYKETSPAFTDTTDAVKWLRNKRRRYANKI